jgi:23S rRNA-/tRNA-specific pseudouridylate synthase
MFRVKQGQSIRVPLSILPDPSQQKQRVSEYFCSFCCSSFSFSLQKEPVLTESQINKIRSMVIYKDDHFIAINKPAGLASQGSLYLSFSVLFVNAR